LADYFSTLWSNDNQVKGDPTFSVAPSDFKAPAAFADANCPVARLSLHSGPQPMLQNGYPFIHPFLAGQATQNRATI